MKKQRIIIKWWLEGHHIVVEAESEILDRIPMLEEVETMHRENGYAYALPRDDVGAAVKSIVSLPYMLAQAEIESAVGSLA